MSSWLRMLAVSMVPTGAMVLIAAASTITPVGPALAVMDTPVPQIEQTVPAQPQASNIKLDLPVSWQLTRARLAGSGTSTLTESFQETWTLELRSGGAIFLSSPRGRVPVYPGDATGADHVNGIPTSIVMAESDLARLVGVQQIDNGAEDQDAALAPVRPVRLVLNKPAKSGTDITLSLSEDEHFAIHIDVGTQSVF